MSDEKKNEILDKEKELDKDELDAVSGGACGCPLVGGGTGHGEGYPWQNESDLKYDCACVGGGVGLDNDGATYCMCPLAGGGTDKPFAQV